MPKFSTTSKERLATCEERLQIVFNAVILEWDCKILEGHRPVEIQQEMFRIGTSKIDGVTKKGNHNYEPSRAVDVVPYPVVWPKDIPPDVTVEEIMKIMRENARILGRIYMFVGYVIGKAEDLGIKLRVGADWDGDHEVRDQRFHDLPHFELVD